MVKIYKQPFAHNGDAIAIPDASQPDGKMSSADGWTPDYQLPKTDPNYKPVGRQEMNGVFKEVTEALGQMQVQGAASWSADGAPYPINAQVYHNGKQWLALRANSVAPTEGADWSAIGTAATANLTTSNVDGTAGRVLKVGDGGWMGQGAAQVAPYGYPSSINDIVNQTKVIRSDSTDNGVPPYLSGIHFSVANTWGRLRVSHNNSEAWIQGGLVDDGSGWTSQVVLSANLLQATGNSTVFTMSQKAITDQLNNIEPLKTSLVLKSVSFGVTYTNTSPGLKFVFVSVYTPSGAAENVFTVTVGGAELFTPQVYGGAATGGFCFAVPSGSTYRVGAPAGATVNRWMEMF